jgi:hypothetical protein
MARIASPLDLAEVLRDHPPSVGIGLERAHVITGDDQVEVVDQAQARQGRQGELARIVGPDGGREPAAPGARNGGEGAGLEHGDLHGPPLVVECDLPDGRRQRRYILLAVRDQLAHAVAVLPRRQGPALVLDELAHIEGHRGEIEGCLDEGVIEIENAQSHAETVPQAC